VGGWVKRNYPLTDCIPASGLEMQMYETIKGYQGRRAPPTLKAENNKTTCLRSEKSSLIIFIWILGFPV